MEVVLDLNLMMSQEELVFRRKVSFEDKGNLVTIGYTNGLFLKISDAFGINLGMRFKFDVTLSVVKFTKSLRNFGYSLT